MKIKITQYKVNGGRKTILQFKDVTNDILQDQYKNQNQNQLLEMINACVSHELRNPLNSIKFQNVEKESLYQEIEKIVSSHMAFATEQRCFECLGGIKKILSKLRESWNIQDSSTELMTFLVQDLLDFAQIKSGKFRKNITRFNIRDIVKKVVGIQQKKANDQGIKLKTEFINIGTKEDSKGEKESPFIFTDQSRVMQVLLGIQSNAIKFTPKGSVTIQVRILHNSQGKYLEVSIIDTGVGIK